MRKAKTPKFDVKVMQNSASIDRQSCTIIQADVKFGMLLYLLYRIPVLPLSSWPSCPLYNACSSSNASEVSSLASMKLLLLVSRAASTPETGGRTLYHISTREGKPVFRFCSVLWAERTTHAALTEGKGKSRAQNTFFRIFPRE